MTRRTARKDSVYVIYSAQHGDNVYIGLTRRGSTTARNAVVIRWRKHISRARHEDREWTVYQYIKGGAWTEWEHEVLAVIRGRAEAYAWERAWVKEHQPSLNDQYIG